MAVEDRQRGGQALGDDGAQVCVALDVETPLQIRVATQHVFQAHELGRRSLRSARCTWRQNVRARRA